MTRLLPLLLLLLVVAPPAQAQIGPISWTVVPGYNGTFKFGAWIPVTVTVTNSGADLRGRLEWRWGPNGTRFAQAVDLPRGANKRVVIPVVAEGSMGDNATLALFDGDRLVASERVRYRQVDTSFLVVGVLSDQSNALVELAGMHTQAGVGTTLVHLESASLPERGELLQSLDLLFVHDVDTTVWSDAQRTAVQSWVAGGGRMVVGGDATVTSSGIGSILPAEAAMATEEVPVRALSQGVGWPVRDESEPLRTLELTPVPGAQIVATTAENVPLLLRRSHGSGEVLQAAFDLTSLSAYGNMVTFWERLLPWSGMAPQWNQLRSNSQWVFRQALTLPALALPSIWSLIAFLGLYIVLVGPLNYLLLRRLDRREWAYLTIPLTVAVFTLAAYAVGASGRGGTPTATVLTVVRATPDNLVGAAQSYVGVFSPVRRSYHLGLDSDLLVSDIGTVFERSGASLEILQTESGVEVPSFLIDVGAVRALIVEQPVEAPKVQVSYTRVNDQRIALAITNQGDRPLTDIAVIAGDPAMSETAQKLDDLAPGESRTVEINLVGFWGDIPFEGGGVINRSSAVNAMRGSFVGAGRFAEMPDMAPAAPPPPLEAYPAPDADGPVPGVDGPVPTAAPDQFGGGQDPFSGNPRMSMQVTLVAWGDVQPIQMALDETPVRLQGDTVYLWSVQEAR